MKSSDKDGAPRSINHRWGGRMLSTGRVAGSAMQIAMRRLTHARAGARDSVLGSKIAKELDGMKGLAMKVGQILSYFDGIFPEETHEALRALQQGASPVAFETMRAVLEEELGGTVDELFEALDESPIASASIGQVYRARVDGSDVAVKVQYPNVQRTFEADFSRVRGLSKLASLATAVDGPAIVDELAERIGEECDYRLEAANQRFFREAFSDHPRIRIPEVISDRSSTRVITSRWQDGAEFYRFQAQSSEAQRNEAGLLLAYFAHHSLYRLGVINADPHPGNYLFAEDGAVIFLDFGCVRRFEPEILEIERRLLEVVIDGRRADFRDALMATGMVAKPKRFDYDVHWDMLRHQYAPYLSTSFQFDFDYIRAGMEYNQPSNPNLRRLAIPPYWIWLQRLQWGLHAVLARLDARGNYADVLREAIYNPPSRGAQVSPERPDAPRGLGAFR